MRQNIYKGGTMMVRAGCWNPSRVRKVSIRRAAHSGVAEPRQGEDSVPVRGSLAWVADPSGMRTESPGKGGWPGIKYQNQGSVGGHSSMGKRMEVK